MTDARENTDNKRTAKKNQTRDLLMTVATGLFNTKGYAETTIRDIALGAEKSTGSVFANWESKRELFFDCFGYWPLEGVLGVMAAHTIKAAAGSIDVTNAADLLWDKMTDPNYFAQEPV